MTSATAPAVTSQAVTSQADAPQADGLQAVASQVDGLHAAGLHAAPDLSDIRQLEQFLYREARYADEHDFDAWEQLWTDDALYWVPIDGTGNDPLTHMSIIYDNRRRIATRLAQLRTGKRYAQAPPSNLRRVISNVEPLAPQEGDGNDVRVGANFVLYESKERGIKMWAGRVTYRLRVIDDEIRLAAKTVVLVNNAEVVPTMGFLI